MHLPTHQTKQAHHLFQYHVEDVPDIPYTFGISGNCVLAGEPHWDRQSEDVVACVREDEQLLLAGELDWELQQDGRREHDGDTCKPAVEDGHLEQWDPHGRSYLSMTERSQRYSVELDRYELLHPQGTAGSEVLGTLVASQQP